MPELKLLLIGPCGTGKSKFLQIASGKHKHPNYYYVPTIGVDVFMINKYDINFLIWDCSGNKRYDFMIKQYINSCNAVVYFTDEVFDSSLIDFLSTCNLPKFAIFTKVIPNPSVFFGWTIVNGINKKESRILDELLSHFKQYSIQVEEFVDVNIKSTPRRWFNKLCCFKRVDSYSSFTRLQ